MDAVGDRVSEDRGLEHLGTPLPKGLIMSPILGYRAPCGVSLNNDDIAKRFALPKTQQYRTWRGSFMNFAIPVMLAETGDIG